MVHRALTGAIEKNNNFASDTIYFRKKFCELTVHGKNTLQNLTSVTPWQVCIIASVNWL